MNKNRPALLVSLSGAVAALLLCAPASAQHADVAIVLRGGTPGIGVDLSKLLTAHVGVRAGAAFYSISATHTQSNVTYNAELKLHSVSALLDLYPMARGSFHLTGGVVTNPATVTATGQPNGSSYTINGTTYTSAQVGVLTGTAKYPSAAPYVGLGFGTPARGGRIMFVVDFGAVIAKPTVSLTATGALADPALAANLQAQVQTTQHDIDRYAKVYPVLSLGLGFRF